MISPETEPVTPPAFISEVSVVVRDFPFSTDTDDLSQRLAYNLEHALSDKWGEEFKFSNQQRQSIENALEQSRTEGGDFDTGKLTESLSAIALEGRT